MFKSSAASGLDFSLASPRFKAVGFSPPRLRVPGLNVELFVILVATIQLIHENNKQYWMLLAFIIVTHLFFILEGASWLLRW